MAKIISLLIILLLLFININIISGEEWIVNSDITNGLVTTGDRFSSPAIFNDSGTYKMIAGYGVYGNDNNGGAVGYYWNDTSSTWISDSSIVNGLPTIILFPMSHVYYNDNCFNLIFTDELTFYGYQWNGTTWISNSSIINGITSRQRGRGATFIENNVLKLIMGSRYTQWDGYYWNDASSIWISDSSLINGLSGIDDGATPNIYKDENNTFKLITGNNLATFNGFYWNNVTSTWISDSSIVNGLTDIGDWSNPSIFILNNSLNLIAGQYLGAWYGWSTIYSTAPSTITLEVRASSNPHYYSTFINDADSTGGFVSSTGYITLTPTITDTNTYPITVENDFSSDGIKLTFVSSDTISSIPLTLTGLKPTKKYSIYESGTLISTFRAPSTTYTYTITTHDEISTFELVKRSTGTVTPPITPPITDNNETSLIILEELPELPIELTELILEDPITTVTTLLSNPVNWLVLLGSYLGIFLGLLLVGKINYPNILLYGTLTWMLSLLVLATGLNFSLNYIFTSTSSILGFLSYTIYGFIMSIYLEIQGEE